MSDMTIRLLSHRLPAYIIIWVTLHEEADCSIYKYVSDNHNNINNNIDKD